MATEVERNSPRRVITKALLVAALAVPTAGQVTSRVSVDSAGTQGNGESFQSSISADGRYVAFASAASNVVSGDTNGAYDIFVRDRLVGTTERVSVGPGGVQGLGQCIFPSISADGRYVAFTSTDSNLVNGDWNGNYDIFVRDREGGVTQGVSVGTGGPGGNGNSGDNTGFARPSISADGRYVAFASGASNLVPGDTNGEWDVFVRDRIAGTTERVSVSLDGAAGFGFSYNPSISADGRYVAFTARASNLVIGDTNGKDDVFVRDRQLGLTERVSVGTGGVQGNSWCEFPSMSADGRFVAFHGHAANLVSGDSNGAKDVFVHDRLNNTTERVSVDSGGVQGNSHGLEPSISADGRYVAFKSFASNLVSGDTNSTWDIFVRDRQSGTTERVSVDSGGAQSNQLSDLPSISADGRYVAFHSLASSLVSGDSNGEEDVFVHDRDATSFTSICDPGMAGVRPCPCSNPPSGPGRGCDNSAATGGASLAASGVAYLSIDSLVFTTSGEKPTALSTVWQGPTTPATGLVYGQGVRCAAGSLKRLFSKSAVGGSITAPNFGAGDLSVSARSAALGAPILPGNTCYYFVSYRDPTVLGGCPSGSTFNATQTGEISWAP